MFGGAYFRNFTVVRFTSTPTGLQSSPKILETPGCSSLSCCNMEMSIAKLRGHSNIAKGKGETKGSEIFQVFQGFCLRLQGEWSFSLPEFPASRWWWFLLVMVTRNMHVKNVHFEHFLHEDPVIRYSGFKRIFFSYWGTDGSRRSRVNEARSAQSATRH